MPVLEAMRRERTGRVLEPSCAARGRGRRRGAVRPSRRERDRRRGRAACSRARSVAPNWSPVGGPLPRVYVGARRGRDTSAAYDRALGDLGADLERESDPTGFFMRVACGCTATTGDQSSTGPEGEVAAAANCWRYKATVLRRPSSRPISASKPSQLAGAADVEVRASAGRRGGEASQTVSPSKPVSARDRLGEVADLRLDARCRR